jgi:hypothetical protein
MNIEKCVYAINPPYWDAVAPFLSALEKKQEIPRVELAYSINQIFTPQGDHRKM